MTAPVPSPRTSPMAGFVDALRRLAIRLYGQRETELRQQINAEHELNQKLNRNHRGTA